MGHDGFVRREKSVLFLVELLDMSHGQSNKGS